MNRLKHGFTLVELMIVVAIIGILAAIESARTLFLHENTSTMSTGSLSLLPSVISTPVASSTKTSLSQV